MYQFSREIEKYEVHYLDNGLIRKKKSAEVEKAIEYATEKMDSGVDVNIKEIVNLVGWY